MNDEATHRNVQSLEVAPECGELQYHKKGEKLLNLGEEGIKSIANSRYNTLLSITVAHLGDFTIKFEALY
jgi:hypothetical protein